MNCSSFEEKIAQYVDDALDRDGAREVEEHLRACGTCAEFADRLESDRVALRTPPSEVLDVDFAAMRSGIREEIAREGRKRVAPALLVAASILLALGIAMMWRISHHGVPAVQQQLQAYKVPGLPTKSGADPLVRGRRPRRPLCLESDYNCAADGGTRGSRADQGVRPTNGGPNRGPDEGVDSRNLNTAIPKADPALEAALREFLADEATPPVSSSPASPIEIRIVTGDPNVVLILLQQSSGASYE